MNLFISFVKLNQSTTTKIDSHNIISLEHHSTKSSNNLKSEKQKQIQINNKMENRSKVINRLALVLLSIVLLELVLIGDQVQPVKAIKKKIFVKKLKKLLPLLALVKPKKKIILLPIPVPMFKNHGHYQGGTYHPQRPMMMDASTPPMSFMMMGSSSNSGPFDGFMEGPGFVGVPLASGDRFPASMSMLPMTMGNNNPNGIDSTPAMMTIVGSPAAPPITLAATNKNITTTTIAANGNNTQQTPGSTPMAMLMPASMTMTIQSEPGGNSAIELSTNMLNPLNGSSMSGNLLQQQRPHTYYTTRWFDKQQQQQLNDNFDFDPPIPGEPNGGEHYYSSPWQSRQPLVSPAKIFRNEKLKQLNNNNNGNRQAQSSPMPLPQSQSQSQTSGRLQQQQQQQLPAVMPILVIKNQWRPTSSSQARDSGGQQSNNNNNFPLEYEELVPVGPPQMMPVYQTPNGQLHMSPPQNLQAPQSPQSPPPPAQTANQQNVAENRGENSNSPTVGEPNPNNSILEHEEFPASGGGSGNRNTLDNQNEGPQVELNNNQNQNLHQRQPQSQQQQQPTFRPLPALGGQRLISSAIKGKQQHKPSLGTRGGY